MTIAEQLLVQDYQRYQDMLQTLQADFSKLPKGSLTTRYAKGHCYCHLQYRDEAGVVHNQRIKDDRLQEMQQAIQRRKELKAEIQSLQQVLIKLEKSFPQLPTLSIEYQAIHSTNTDSKKPYRTAKGDYVRSKSELIIANELYAKQIPYEYEKPLSLEGCRYAVYPDFTIYTPHEKQVVYWEHAGLMTDLYYRDKWERKRKSYERNGICEWNKNLIVTYESESGDLNTDLVRQIVTSLSLR